MAHLKRTRWIAVAAVTILLTSGCTLQKAKQEGSTIDQPPANVEAAMLDGKTAPDAGQSGAQAQAADAAVKATEVTLYYEDANGHVAPLSMGIPVTNLSVAKTSLEYMVDGGPEKDMLPKGFTALIPKGTKIKGIKVDAQKLATVDFSDEFASYNPQDERKIMEAVTWTLTGFPSIQKVQFQIKGKALKEMPVYNTPLDQPLTRAMGINLELAPGGNLGQTMPVTVYFPNTAGDQFTYFVPVTRMVNRTDEARLAQVAIDELLKGPLQEKGLSAVFAPATQALVKQQDDTGVLSVDFNDKLLDASKKASPEAVEAVVLSLSENTGAGKVQITVNGSAKISTTDNQSFSKPVVRPEHLNAVKM